MANFMTAGQLVTKEAVKAALVDVIRDRDVVKVRVECAECGALTTTWLRPTDDVVPYCLCAACERYS